MELSAMFVDNITYKNIINNKSHKLCTTQGVILTFPIRILNHSKSQKTFFIKQIEAKTKWRVNILQLSAFCILEINFFDMTVLIRF